MGTKDIAWGQPERTGGMGGDTKSWAELGMGGFGRSCFFGGTVAGASEGTAVAFLIVTARYAVL